eukprot:4625302-Prymnesium_polylepis.1
MTLDLPRTSFGWPHVIVPYTFDPGEEGDFVLSVTTEADFKFQELAAEDEWHHVALLGEWTAHSGGCPNPENRLWQNNPQWGLRVTQNATVILSLERTLHAESHDASPAMGCLVLQSTARNKPTIPADHVIAHTGFVPLAQASVQVELPASAEPYLLVACTFEPGQK